MKHLLATTALILATSASAADITSRLTENDGNAVLELSGPIVPGDEQLVQRELDRWKANEVHVTGIRLNSMGGNVIEGARIARVVQRNGLDTVVGKNASCVSICFTIFAAGKHKFANGSSRFAVHSVGINGEETELAHSITSLIVRNYKEFGVPDSVIAKAVTTPPNQLAPVNSGELIQMGTTILGGK